jgi:hypothetical protein
MRPVNNPFRSRASEQQRDHRTFLRTFGPGSIDLLPPAIWDRLLVLRSAPGAGKTSLMRLFSSESLKLISERDEFRDLAEKMHGLGAIAENQPAWLGVMLNLSRNYRGLVDVAPSKEAATRLFFRLLDARIMIATIRGALAISGGHYPTDARLVHFRVEDSDDGFEHAARVGGTVGGDIAHWAQSVESEMLDLLDSLLPVAVQDDRGHAELYSLRLLSTAQITVDGHPVAQRPLIMLDDGHNLAGVQRDALLASLGDRSLRVARWYSERYEALSASEILATLGKKGRDYELVELENVARGTMPDGERQRFRPGQFERVLTDIGNRRAAIALKRHADEDAEFAELIDAENDDFVEPDQLQDVVNKMRERLVELQAPRYREWIDPAITSSGYLGALRMREIEILVARDKARSQQELFPGPLSDAESRDRSSSGLREAAKLALAEEFGLPFYFGHDVVARLGSQNIEQYLVICGDLFAEMLARVTMDEDPRLSAIRQDRIIRRTSDLLWRQIPRQVPHGRDVQAFIEGIVIMARQEARKPTVPYPPGVTGTAMLMSDRERLLQPEYRSKIAGAERLYLALAEAVAHNLISAELDRSSKNQQVMVLTLNRLLCPRFGLAIGRGGFRERRLDGMAAWIIEAQPETAASVHLEQALPL